MFALDVCELWGTLIIHVSIFIKGLFSLFFHIKFVGPLT